MKVEIFKSATHSNGKFAGVFEFDGEAGYLYLCNTSKEKGQQIFAHVRVFSTPGEISESSIIVKWNKLQDVVGVYVRGILWAALGIYGGKYGGDYMYESIPNIPAEIDDSF